MSVYNFEKKQGKEIKWVSWTRKILLSYGENNSLVQW